MTPTMMILKATTGKVRTEKRDGKTYTVVPVVALVEGVLQAMNAKTPEFVRAATYEPTPPLWNGRPLFLGHPLVNGRPVSGAIPSILAKSIGVVGNCEVRDGKLCMEAWLDDRAPKELLARVNSGEPIEVSVGVFVDTDTSEGEHNGKRYLGEWHNMVPDHLAILPEGDIGACSWAAGCGVRAASLRTGGDDEMTEKPKGAISAIVTALQSLFRTADTSDSEVRQDLYDYLRAQGISGDVVDVYDGYFVYCIYNPTGMGYYRRDFTKDATGAVASIGADATEVEPKRTYEPLAAASITEPEPKAAGCGCSKEKLDMTKLEIAKFLETATEDQIKALSAVAQPPTAAEVKAAADKVAADLKVAADAKAAEDKVIADKAIADKAAADKAAPAAVKAPTFDELLQAADPDTRQAIQAGRVAAASQKAATIVVLKASNRCDYTDEQLKAMSQADLDRLVKLAGVPATTSVDYSGQGGPRVALDQNAVAAPPDLTVAIKAARGVKA